MTTRKPDHRVYRFRMLSRLIFVALLSIGSDCDEEEDRRPEPPLEKYTTTVAPAVIPMSLGQTKTATIGVVVEKGSNPESRLPWIVTQRGSSELIAQVSIENAESIPATLSVTSVNTVTEERLKKDIWDLTDGVDEVPITINATRSIRHGSFTFFQEFFGAQVVVFVTFDPNALDLPIIPLSEAPRIAVFGGRAFGNVELDIAKVARGSIQNRGQGTLVVSSITLESGGDFNLGTVPVPASLKSSGVLHYGVVFQPREEGRKNTRVLIQSNDDLFPLIGIPMTGTGVKPAETAQ